MLPRIDDEGKFKSADGKLRTVRGFRITESQWNAIKNKADEYSCSTADLLAKWCDQGCELSSSTGNSLQLENAIAILEKSLTLKANSGGAIKAEVRLAIDILKGEVSL